MQFFVPIPFSLTSLPYTQEPKTASDSPTPTAPPAGTPNASTSAPGQGGAPGPQQSCFSGEMMFLLPAMLALMYFMVLRPEQKRKKEQQNLLSSIKQGDNVVTVGGMHGVVSRLTEKTVTLRVDSQQITFDRVAIARVNRDDGAASPAKTS